jgi:ABC-type multidrug transport system fused ATPase/permease subunit
MSPLQCSVWDNGRISTCFQRIYLSGLLAIGTCSVSLIILISVLIHRHISPVEHKFSRLAGTEEDADATPEGVSEPTAFINNTVSYVVSHGPKVAVLELVLLLADVAVCAILLVHAPQTPSAGLSPLPVALSSSYLFILAISRRVVGTARPRSFTLLGTQSSILYTFHWLFSCAMAHAVLINPPSTVWRISTLAHFALFTLLVLFASTAPRNLIDLDMEHETYPGLTAAKEPTASLLSHLTFSWVGSLVWKGFRVTLQVSDLFDLNSDQKAARVAPSFQVAAATTLPFLWRLYRYFKKDLVWQGAWAAAMSVTVFLPALLLKQILKYLEKPDSLKRSTVWLCVVGLFVSGILTSISDCQCEWIGRKISAKLNAIIISEVYAKVLRRKPGIGRGAEAEKDASLSEGGPPVGSDNKTAESDDSFGSDGNVLNLMAVDAAKISEVGAYLHLLWVSVPFQIIIATWMLYNILGISGVVGFVLMIALMPLNVLVAKRQGEAQEKVMAATDARIQSVNEVITNIRIIKYCAWEHGFSKRVNSLRSVELRKLRTRFIWWSLSMTVWYSIPLLITMTTLFFYTVVFKNSLENSVAFPALAVFGILRMPLDRVSDMISFVLQAHVSVLRVDKFLAQRETGKYSQLLGTEHQNSKIGFENTTLVWSSGESEDPPESPPEGVPMLSIRPRIYFRLANLDISFHSESLNVVYGPSGSGKSSLLLALLGEMDLLRGQIFLPLQDHDLQQRASVNLGKLHTGITAYCSQEPWILNQSVRRNIIFGSPFDGKRYEMVLNACALSQDIAALDKGDQTMAGDNGARLSGGQKQRVALARALYSHALHVLLDDCLSAVDAHTANHIFFNAIKGPLMRGRTCILATHNIQLAIPHCSYAVCLENGAIKGKGTAEELVSMGLFGQSQSGNEIKLGEPNPAPTEALVKIGHDDDKIHSIGLSGDALFEHRDSEVGSDFEEAKSEGAVGWSAVQSYLHNMGGGKYWALVLLAFAFQQFASLGTNLWIKAWAQKYETGQPSLPGKAPNKVVTVDAAYYLAIYASICAGFITISLLRDALTFWGSLQAAFQMHERLLHSMLFAKLIFFDHTPLGQITNRFSKDIEAVDQELAPYSISTFHILSSLAMVIVLISVVLPAFLIASVVVCIIYWAIAAVYINSSRDLKRIEAVERSPLYQHFGETLTGYVSIRAYHRISAFTAQNYDLIDNYNRPHILLWASKEWLTFRIACTSSLISCLTGAFVLWNLGTINSGAAGLVLTYSATFTENVLFFVQLYAEIQQNLNSVERVLEYTNVTQEPTVPPHSQHDVPSQWPSRGHVQFNAYTTRYAPNLEPVLKDVCFEAKPGERVAIVGRTGAGKSTLALSLIRGLEADSGEILIDGINIATPGLEKLRSAITVVPQDPTLFEGSLRDNLDPLGHYSDERIISALHSIKLPGFLAAVNIDSLVTNLSLGQRQLLCIARALLRQSRILVLDEATASIDHETDALIQASIRSSINSGTTVLTIAHRLQTIADYDRVIVLDAGSVVENGSVKELLLRRGPKAAFRKFCKETGDLEGIERAANAPSQT